MKKSIISLFVTLTLAICMTSCFYLDRTDPQLEMGERYDSDITRVSESGRSIGKIRFNELFQQYSEALSETEFVVHESTAVAIAIAVMRELYPNDTYVIDDMPRTHQNYYKTEHCWEVWLLNESALNTTLNTSEENSGSTMLVYVDINSGAVRAIIPASEFSVHNPANSEALKKPWEER